MIPTSSLPYGVKVESVDADSAGVTVERGAGAFTIPVAVNPSRRRPYLPAVGGPQEVPACRRCQVSLRPSSDEALVRAVYAEHGGALFGYVLRLVAGDRQRAEDIVQETLLRAWRHPEALHSQGSAPAPDVRCVPGCSPWPATSSSTPTGPGWQTARGGGRRARTDPRTGRDRQGARGLAGRRRARVAVGRAPGGRRRDLLPRSHRGAGLGHARASPPGTVKSRAYYALRALRLALTERGVTL